jgi:hypothetical protein
MAFESVLYRLKIAQGLTLLQIFFGSASIYSLLVNEVEIGLLLMFTLFVLISLKFLLIQPSHDINHL